MEADKLLLGTYRGCEAAFLLQDSKLIQMQVNAPQDYRIGDIFVGKVKNIVPSIQAAFVQFMDGQVGFLPLSDVKRQSILHYKEGRALKCEDEIVVQVKKEPVKTKDAVLTTDICFQSESFVFMPYSNGIHYSKKLSAGQKKQLWELIAEIVEMIFGDIHVFLEKYGLIVRTNAADASKEALFSQLHDLFHEAGEILHIADKRTVFSKIYTQESFYAYVLKNTYHIEALTVLTERQEIYTQLEQMGLQNLKLYQDTQIDLFHLYGLGAQIDEIFEKKVWLKSGGYLVIEPTEAMTVIDVNSGKAAKKKDAGELYYKVNMEAAAEIARQLRLRNISGIIVVDFINMENNEYQKALMNRLRELFFQDPVDTALIDMTKLELIEITRKKTTPPLADVLRRLDFHGQ